VAKVEEFVAINAPRDRVFDLIRDRAQRHRFMPEGWRVLQTLSSPTDEIGASMEIEWQVGPGLTVQVVQLLDVSEHNIIEGPPPGDNYMTTWTVAEHQGATWVGIKTEFSYGDIISEWFVKRRLGKAYRRMLQRLKQVSEEEA
jgi:uncharacterized protein YndB with AHSA1/START domain